MDSFVPIASTSSRPPGSSNAPSQPSSGNKRAAGAAAGTKTGAEDAKAPKRIRQRQALSCQECRRLKLKCDRVWPCSSCRKRGCPDICPSGTSKPPGRAVRIAAEFAALLRRVEDLEAVVKDLGGAERIPPPLKLEEAHKRSTTITPELEREIEEGGAASGAEGAREFEEGEEHDEEEDKPTEEQMKKMLVGVGALSIGESGRTRFVGAAAGPAFSFEDEEVGDTTAEEDEDPLSTDIISRYPFIQVGSGYPSRHEVERLRAFLPELDEAKRLSENYWNYLSFQFTPVESTVYWDDYFTAAFMPQDPHGTKLACVFIVLSLGTLFDPSLPSTPNPLAHHYFVLSQAVLSASRFLSNGTLAAIQTLQLSANYLLNFHDLREGGESLQNGPLAMAGRMLVTQGLHRDGESFGLSGDELNRRRRVFYELLTLERMQAFISGRPYMLGKQHFDTKFPDDADDFCLAKWKLGLLIGKVIGNAFSVAAPSYSTILALDQSLRDLVSSTPDSLRSGALPHRAFVDKPQGIPQVPPSPSAKLRPGELEAGGEELIFKMRQHTMDQMFSQVLFYLHKPGFAQALLNHPDEPLRSPWAASVAAVSLETAVYLLAVAKSWVGLHPVVCPRWWHIFFHAFAASVAQSSLVIKSPSSMLAPHAWSQLNEAVSIFEHAGASGAPVAAFVPRLKVLREKAFGSLQAAIAVPLGLALGGTTGGAAGGRDGEGEADATSSILGPPTRLERRGKKKPTGSGRGASGTPGSTSSLDGASPSSVTSPSAAFPTSTPTSSSAAADFASGTPAMQLDPASSAIADLLTATDGLSAQAPPISSTLFTSIHSAPSTSATTADAQMYTPFDDPILLPQVAPPSAPAVAQPVPAQDAGAAAAAAAVGAESAQAAAAAYYQHYAALTMPVSTPSSSSFPPGYSTPADARRPSTSSATLPTPPPLVSPPSSANPVSYLPSAADPQAFAASYAATLQSLGLYPPPPPSLPELPRPATASSSAGTAPTPPFSLPSLPSLAAFSPYSPTVGLPSYALPIPGAGGLQQPNPNPFGAPQFSFGGFVTAFPMPGASGAGGGSGAGETGGEGAGAAGAGLGYGGLSPLDWDKYREA
ncbi:hypothetical protein JCM8097_004118 [Rhodosporidiobolus ruineniae]